MTQQSFLEIPRLRPLGLSALWQFHSGFAASNFWHYLINNNTNGSDSPALFLRLKRFQHDTLERNEKKRNKNPQGQIQSFHFPNFPICKNHII